MSEVTAVTLEELSSSREWRALGGQMKRLLSDALVSRNLVDAISSSRHVDDSTARQIAFGLLRDQDVLAIVLKYALGVSATAPQDEFVARS